jgi:hypothetical protein
MPLNPCTGRVTVMNRPEPTVRLGPVMSNG